MLDKNDAVEAMKQQQKKMELVMVAMGELSNFKFDQDKFKLENGLDGLDGLNDKTFKQHIIFFAMREGFFNEIKEEFLSLGLKFEVVSNEISFGSTTEVLHDYIVHINPEDVYILKPIIGFWWLEEFLAFMNENQDIDESIINKLGLEKSWHTQVPQPLIDAVQKIVREIGFSPISFGLPPYLNKVEIQRNIALLMPIMMQYASDSDTPTVAEDIRIWKSVMSVLKLYDRIMYNITGEISKEIVYNKDVLVTTFKLIAGDEEKQKEFYDLKNLEIINNLFQACFVLFQLDEKFEDQNEKILEIYDIFQELKNDYEKKVNEKKEQECQIQD